MNWLRRWRRPGPASAAASAAWDACIDLNPADLPRGVGREAAVGAAVAAVEALSGAGWISAEVHPHTAPVSARVFPAGTSLERMEEPWPSLRMRVADTARQAVLGLAPAARASGWGTMPPQAAMGFSDAGGAIQLDALRELAALAASVRPLPVPAVTPKPRAGPADAEMMGRLLGFVLPGDGRATAAAALARFGSFAGVLAAPEAELRQVPGLGMHSVAAVRLVQVAALRLAQAAVAETPVLAGREALFGYLSAALARERVEQFRILFLDRDGTLLKDEVQGTGTVNHTPVYPREVVRRALELGAAGVVLVHNHPSGDPSPSEDDLRMTAAVQGAAAALSVTVLDHIIVGGGRCTSFRDAGLL